MTVPKDILESFPVINKKKMNHLLSLPKGTNRMILDTDTANEIDDQFALAWTLLSKDKIDLVGVTAEPYSFQHHRDDLLKTENLLRDNKKNFEKNDLKLIEEYQGWVEGLLSNDIKPSELYFDTPEEGVEKSYKEILNIFSIMNENPNNKVFRGSPGYLESYNTPIKSDSSEFIINEALKNDDKPLYISAIGCLTNIASAMLIEPKIISNIVIVWTSGFPSRSLQNNTPSLNLVQDKLASQLLFDCGVANVYLPGYHIGAQLTLSLPDMDKWVKDKGAIGNYLYYLYTNNPIHKQRGIIDQTWRSWVIWDMINIAWMINPDWVPTSILESPVLDDNLYWQNPGNRHIMREAYSVNRDAIFYDFFKKIS